MLGVRADEVAALKAFEALSQSERIRFFALFGHNMTIAARDTYEFQAPGVRAPQRLRAINELQHRVLGQLHALTIQGAWLRSDQAILSIMLEHEDEHLRGQASWAFERAMKTLQNGDA